MSPAAAKWILAFTGIVFVAFGLAFLAVPARLIADVGIVLDQAVARIEIRSVYGGMNLGMGILLLYWSRAAATVRHGLTAAMVVLGGIAAARIVAIVLAGGSAPALIYVFLGMEVGGALIAAWARTGTEPDAASTEPAAPAEPPPAA